MCNVLLFRLDNILNDLFAISHISHWDWFEAEI